MTAEQIIKAAIPGADSEIVDHILWGRTPFPMGKVTARDIYKAAAQWRRATEQYKRLCDFCNNLVTGDEWYCGSCALKYRSAP